MRLSLDGAKVAHEDGASPVSHEPTSHVWAIFAAVRDPSPQRPSKKTVALMPVPHTFTTGAFGLETRWSASPMHTLRLPWPAPSPSTAWFSMYTFWLMSSFTFRARPAEPQQRREAKMSAFMPAIFRGL